jgi:putative acetyltransferase
VITMTLRITVDDLTGPAIQALLREHVDQMRAITPPESKHALDLDALRHPDITLWTAHDGDHLLGCAALKHLDPHNAEIKSMRTATSAQRRGVATTLLTHLIEQARHRGYQRLYLETGTADFFHPARTLYQRFGFQPCEPFADYRPDPNSTHLTKILT